MPPDKFEREHAAKMDKQQYVLAGGTIKPNLHTKAASIQSVSETALCPFCLYQGQTREFTVSCAKGYDKRLGKCPECGVQAMWKTLHKHWKTEEFAAWVFNYSLEGFWSKCKFAIFNERLRAHGILDRFWTEYRKRKGDIDDHTETSYEYYERKAQEEAQQYQSEEK